MNADTVRPPQIGDRVRFRDNDIDDTGIVTEVLRDNFVNVRWNAVPIESSHRPQELVVIPEGPTREHYDELLRLLAAPDDGTADE